MSTKAQITTEINTIDDGGLNDAAEVRAVYEVLNDNFYGIKTTDNNASTNVFTEDDADKIYSVATSKNGGVVSNRFTLRNNTGAILPSNTVWLTITNTEYEQQASSPVYQTGQSASNGDNIRFLLTTNTLANLEPIGIGEVVYLNINYNTNA